MSNQEIAAIRALIGQTPLDLPPAQMRVIYDALGAQFSIPTDVTMRPDKVGDMAAEWMSPPQADTARAILYLHGGGYVTGSIASHRHLVAELGRTARVQTFAIDYRLAPENQFPAAVDDALAAYRFLLDADFASTSLVIAGDSAGGGLTIAMLLAAREAGLPQPACAVCISPWVDLEAMGTTATTKAAEDPLVQRDGLLQVAAAYLGRTDARHPLASPLHADLRGLAPLLIQVGSAEMLLDDSVRLAAAAGAQDVDVRLEIWPQMIHVWPFFHPMLCEGRRALSAAGAFIRERMSRT